jgi:formyltetrahydrofolate-dependent phosphoribosylglycinamide formyltransferase
MFKNLQQKWQISGWQFVLVIMTFAIGGSLTGYVGRKLMSLLQIDNDVFYTVVYIILISILWPLAVIIVSIVLGQFTFFRNYLMRMGKRMSGKKVAVKGPIFASPIKTPHYKMTKVAIFASGAGSNAQKIIDHFRDHSSVKISLIVCNKPGAGVLQIAEKENIPTLLIEKEQFFRGDHYVHALKAHDVSFIILAGFLWKIPGGLVEAFRGHIINIHPALLPKYGGKGMYGQFVHAAVIEAAEKESGITIHYVDEQYDHGSTIFQATCEITPDDTPETLAQKIHALEHAHFPRIVEEVILQLKS